MQAYDLGERQSVLARRFCISEKTIYLWRKQRISRGHPHPITKYQKGHSHKIADLARFKAFVVEHQGKTIKEMAKIWGGIGKTTMSKNLKAIGFTRKKKLWLLQ